jgi:hypothetical protein
LASVSTVAGWQQQEIKKVVPIRPAQARHLALQNINKRIECSPRVHQLFVVFKKKKKKKQVDVIPRLFYLVANQCP